MIAEYAAPLLAWAERSSRGRGAATPARSADGEAAAAAAAWSVDEIHPVAAVRRRRTPASARLLESCVDPEPLPPPAGNGQQTAASGNEGARLHDASLPNGHGSDRFRRYRSGVDGHRLRDREPEGRGRQDDDRGQPRRLHRRGRLRRPARRHRPAGQRDARARRRQGHRAEHLRRPAGRSTFAGAVARPAIEQLELVPAHPDLAAANTELPREPGSEMRLREALGGVRERLRVRDARLPAVARAADRQRARRGRPRDRPGPDGVLRAGGAGRAARHARRSSSASSTRA